MPLNCQMLLDANGCLRHRGPDAAGSWTDETEHVFLGHRRLSIIDLDEAANQPMVSACGRYVMVYNGEVYNFPQLKQKLKHVNWRTHSDTEVVLELFAEFGEQVFPWLNGMFALAIYDRRDKQLILARDQLGIKPLFYQYADGELVFASELKFIATYTQKRNRALKVEREAIPFFLHLGYIPEPLTIYQGVHKFPAGHYAVVKEPGGGMEITRYWNAEQYYPGRAARSEAEALASYRDLLFSSVQDQMVSDVPVGTFLSGGIDSSLVTAVASQVSKGRVNSFSIGFKEPRYDESQYAEAVAKHLGTDHHRFMVSVDDVLEQIPALLDVYDEPFADSSAFPTMLVSKLARQKVTVTLSGDGGDELFHGYGMYQWADRMSNPLLRTVRKPLYLLTQQMSNRMKRGGAIFNYPHAERLPSHIFSQEQYFFSEQELSKLLQEQSFDFGALNSLPAGGTAAERQAYWDITHYLKDDLLVKVDRASMRYSLETRVPLLDLRLVEFALNLDVNLKLRQPVGTKYLMKRVLYELVPQGMFERPKKGFAIPLKDWLKGPLRHLIDEHLSSSRIQEYSIVKVKEVEMLLKRFESGEDYLYNRIWVLVVLHWWLRTQKQEL